MIFHLRWKESSDTDLIEKKEEGSSQDFENVSTAKKQKVDDRLEKQEKERKETTKGLKLSCT